MNSFLATEQNKRLAFDMGARGAVSRENIAAYVNEAGVCVSIEEAISVFHWRRANGGVVCEELNNDEDVSEYLDWSSEVSRRESWGTMAMREFFLTGGKTGLQIMPPLVGVYNEGRGVLMLANGQKAELFGFRIGRDFFDKQEWTNSLVKISKNPVGESEQLNDAIRQTCFGLRKDLSLDDLVKVLPELAYIWQRIGDGRARENFERLKKDMEPLVAKYGSLTEKTSRRDEYVRMGAAMEKDLGMMGMGVAGVSGCGWSNRAFMEKGSGGGGLMGGGVWLQSEVQNQWRKPEEKWKYNKEGKWRKFVKVDKCGFHWKNGGTCTWEPKDFVEVGSMCPCCKRKFVCG